jgi:hypothetical protein
MDPMKRTAAHAAQAWPLAGPVTAIHRDPAIDHARESIGSDWTAASDRKLIAAFRAPPKDALEEQHLPADSTTPVAARVALLAAEFSCLFSFCGCRPSRVSPA